MKQTTVALLAAAFLALATAEKSPSLQQILANYSGEFARGARPESVAR